MEHTKIHTCKYLTSLWNIQKTPLTILSGKYRFLKNHIFIYKLQIALEQGGNFPVKSITKEESGFNLIEVVASIVIIGIILISFSQLFIQSNKTAAHNNEKLVTINLADAMLVKLKSETFTKDSSITDMNKYFKDSSEPDHTKKKPPLAIQMNGKTYAVSYQASQSNSKLANSNYSEEALGLIKVVVTVTAPNGKIKGSSEGYVSLE